jgi:hypothetical protein
MAFASQNKLLQIVSPQKVHITNLFRKLSDVADFFVRWRKSKSGAYKIKKIIVQYTSFAFAEAWAVLSLLSARFMLYGRHSILTNVFLFTIIIIQLQILCLQV